jgi:hypothetical protein
MKTKQTKLDKVVLFSTFFCFVEKYKLWNTRISTPFMSAISFNIFIWNLWKIPSLIIKQKTQAYRY